MKSSHFVAYEQKKLYANVHQTIKTIILFWMSQHIIFCTTIREYLRNFNSIKSENSNSKIDDRLSI